MNLIKLAADKLAAYADMILTDDEFRFGRIKQDTKNGRFSIPDPQPGDPDNIRMVKDFRGVVVHFEKNFFLSDEDKAAGKAPKEKRVLYILRDGSSEVEIMYLSPSSTYRWDATVTALSKKELHPRSVEIEFTGAHVKTPQYEYYVTECKDCGVLSEEDADYILELASPVYERSQRYKATPADASAVDAAINAPPVRAAATAPADNEETPPSAPRPARRSALVSND